MVYRDYWALSQWYRHFASMLDARHLYVIAHGDDPKIARLCPDAHVVTVPRGNLAGFDRVRGDTLNQIQDELGAVYDWVIRTDVDELICLDPAFFSDFPQVFDTYADAHSIFALGFDLVESAEEMELPESDPVFSHRRNAVFSGHYSKAFAVRRGTHLARHGIVQTSTSAFTLPRGVYLAHLKYANIDALQVANEHRVEIANGSEAGLPGEAWRKAGQKTRRFLHRFETLPHVDWPVASDMAFDLISKEPETTADKGILRAKSLQFDHRTLLPEWFADD